MWKNIKPYVISIAIALGVGVLAALLTQKNMELYSSLRRPALAPPSFLFPIVWTALYILMGIGSALVYRDRRKNPSVANSALRVYSLQLTINFFWSIIFFNLMAFLPAFFWLLLLWALIAVMIYKFSKVNKTAAYLQIPYIVWVTFAGYLTFMINVLN